MQPQLFSDERSGYRGPAVAKIVGISYRQLDHWTTKGIVDASVQSADGSGTQRLYAFDDIVKLKVIKRLRDAGVSLQKITRVLDALADRGLGLDDVTLMADTTGQVYAVDDQQHAIDILMSGQGVFAVALGPVLDETEADIVGIPTEHAEPAVERGHLRRVI